MFGLRRDVQRQLGRALIAVVLAVLAGQFGHKSLSGRQQQRPDIPLPEAVKGPGRPIDGDSLYVGRDEVRLKGIDAPEGKQTCTLNGAPWACGNAARDELKRLIGSDIVECQATERDKHGRVLGSCSAAGRNLNAGMVASGLAVAYGGYLREEGDARVRKRGVWAGDFERPREWRHERGIGL